VPTGQRRAASRLPRPANLDLGLYAVHAGSRSIRSRHPPTGDDPASAEPSRPLQDRHEQVHPGRCARSITGRWRLTAWTENVRVAMTAQNCAGRRSGRFELDGLDGRPAWRRCSVRALARASAGGHQNPSLASFATSTSTPSTRGRVRHTGGMGRFEATSSVDSNADGHLSVPAPSASTQDSAPRIVRAYRTVLSWTIGTASGNS
jgi:hypothetical protein